jgi:WD40 repeat protein
VPANLLVEWRADGLNIPVLWITDFGLAHCQSQVGLTMTGDLVGTLRYMSPEQALAKRLLIDHRTDIYSLGVTLYELLTLEPAFNGSDREELLRQIAFEEPLAPRQRNKAIPLELETILLKSIEKSPEARYATSQELADDLRCFLEDKPIRARRPTLMQGVAKWSRRHQGVVRTGIVGLIVALVILVISTLLILSAYRGEAKERQSAVTALYHSRVQEAQAIRRARGDGYRTKAWQLLQQARQLETPDKDLKELREEAVACLGDFAGLDPATWNHFPADVDTIAMHPNGRLLAIGFNNGKAVLRDLATGQETPPLPQHTGTVTMIAFSPDGTRLVTGDSEGIIHICEAKANGEWALARTIRAEPVLAGLIPSAAFPFFVPQFVFRKLRSIAISSDGKQLAGTLSHAAFLSSTIALWNLGDGSRGANFERGLERLFSPAFSPDGKFLSACYDRFRRQDGSLQPQHGVFIWDLRYGGEPLDLSPELGFLNSALFSADGRLLACACEEGLALFDTTNFQCLRFPQAERTPSVAFSPDSRLLAIANNLLGQVRQWNIASNREVAVLGNPSRQHDMIHSVACSRDALVAASRRAVHKWNLAGTGEKFLLAGHRLGITCAVFSPDGKLLASAGKDKRVRIWEPTTGDLKELPLFGESVETLAFSHDGKLLATGDWAGAIQFWDVATGKKIAALPDDGQPRIVWSVAFSPDGRYFAACGGGGVTLWCILPSSAHPEAAGGLVLQLVHRMPFHCAAALTFSPDSELLAFVDWDSTARVWDLAESHELPFPRVRPLGRYKCLAFHGGSKHLLFVEKKTGLVEVWDIKSGLQAFCIGGPGANERNETARLDCIIALSSDGSRLAGIRGRNVTIWDTASKNLLLKMPEEQGAIYCLAWSPDREHLAVGTSDGELAIWDLGKIKTQLDEIGLGW